MFACLRWIGPFAGLVFLQGCASLPSSSGGSRETSSVVTAQDYRTRAASVLTDACALRADDDGTQVFRRVSTSLADSAAAAISARLKQEGYAVRGVFSPMICGALGGELGDVMVADEREQPGTPGIMPMPHSPAALSDERVGPAVGAFLRAVLAEDPQLALDAEPVVTFDRVRALVGADYLWVATLTARDSASGGVFGAMLRGRPPYARDGTAVAFVDLAARQVIWQDHKRWPQTEGGPAQSAWAGKLLHPFVAPLEISVAAAVPVENPNFAPVASPSAVATSTIPVALEAAALPDPGQPVAAPERVRVRRTPTAAAAPVLEQAPIPELERADARLAAREQARSDRAEARASGAPPPPPPVIPPVGKPLLEVTDFRRAPTNSSEVIRQLPKGLRVVVESDFRNRFGRWFFVSIGNEQGWIPERGLERPGASW